MGEIRCICPSTDAADCADLRTYGYAPARDPDTFERRSAEDSCGCGCHDYEDASWDEDDWSEEQANG